MKTSAAVAAFVEMSRRRTRIFRLGASLLLFAGCAAPMAEDVVENPHRYQIVVESLEFSPTKPGGAPWDAIDGKPDPCVLVGDEWSWNDMTPIAFDQFSPVWSFVTSDDYDVEALGHIGLTINDEDFGDEDDGESAPEPTPEPTPGATPEPTPEPTPPDNGLICDKIEGNEIGVEGETLQVGTKIVTFHDWVLKVGESNEYHGFSWDQTGTVDVWVKAGNEKFLASGGSWLHPGAGTNAPAISNVEVCLDTDDQLHTAVVSLVPDDEDGQTFVIEPGPGKGVEHLVISVRKSELSD